VLHDLLITGTLGVVLLLALLLLFKWGECRMLDKQNDELHEAIGSAERRAKTAEQERDALRDRLRRIERER
jgi:F0F1-type ATP synthase membrane subunit b/b'